MKKAFKVRLAVFLSIMLVLPTICSVLPMTATEVSAASNVTMSWYWQHGDKDTEPIQVEKGQKFYIGDYVSMGDWYSPGYTMVASMVKASYSSSDKSVATIKSNGYLTAKKVGTTTITVKYKGKKITTKLQVVPAGTFGKAKYISGLKKQADKLAKNIPSEVTTKNGFSLYKAAATYCTYADGVGGYIEHTTSTMHAGISREGLLEEGMAESYTVGNTVNTYRYIGRTNKLAVPQAGRYLYISGLLEKYSLKNSATSTRGAKLMKIKSVSATTNGITIKLKKKLTTEQILGARIQSGFSKENTKGKTTAYDSIPIYDVETGDYVWGYVQMKQGSNIVKITPRTFVNGKAVSEKLEKGKTYQLGSKTNWAKAKTVKVK